MRRLIIFIIFSNISVASPSVDMRFSRALQMSRDYCKKQREEERKKKEMEATRNYRLNGRELTAEESLERREEERFITFQTIVRNGIRLINTLAEEYRDLLIIYKGTFSRAFGLWGKERQIRNHLRYLIKKAKNLHMSLDLSGLNLSKVRLSNINFKDVKLAKVDFSRALIDRCKFNKTNLGGANFSGSELVVVEINQTNIRGAKFFGSDLSHLYIDGKLVKKEDLHPSQYNQDTTFGVYDTGL
jgi:hypothetical protein